jgi:hypothetical protein
MDAQDLPDAPSAVIKCSTSRKILVMPAYRRPRGHKKLLTAVGVVGLELVADHYDVSETEKGLKAGVGNEGYTWLVGTRPSAGQLYSRDMLVFGITATPSLIAYLRRSSELFYGGLGAPVTLAVKHIYAGNGWRRLLEAHTN